MSPYLLHGQDTTCRLFTQQQRFCFLSFSFFDMALIEGTRTQTHRAPVFQLPIDPTPSLPNVVLQAFSFLCVQHVRRGVYTGITPVSHSTRRGRWYITLYVEGDETGDIRTILMYINTLYRGSARVRWLYLHGMTPRSRFQRHWDSPALF